MLDRVKKAVPRPLTNSYHHLQSSLASYVYSHPERKLKLIGVTGTDGKTTTVNLIYHILKTAGYKVGLISTVRAVIGDKDYDTGLHVTTPSPWAVKGYLQKMVAAGTQLAVVEVTSHALDQNRVASLQFDYGVVTNISHEHLDYHKSLVKYTQAKAKLIKHSTVAVLNKDDDSYSVMQQAARGKIISFAIKNKADLKAGNIKLAPYGTHFKEENSNMDIKTPLIGNFNVYNCLAAIAIARDLGIENTIILKALKSFPALAGRMQRLEEGQNFTVIVDFAHTPQALGEALKTLRGLTRSRLIAVFGTAGERDTQKRPMMGKIAVEGADLIVLTSEDPRGEDPNNIMTEIASGVVKSGGVLNTNFWMIKDRGQAIKFAVQTLAKTGDVVAIFGKGHEKSMNIKGVEVPWSDQETVVAALKGRKKI